MNADEQGACPEPVGPPTTSVVAERVVAAVAAHAALTVAGVVRLEPGLFGLAESLARSVRHWVTGLDPAPTEGVRVRVEPAGGAAREGARAWVEVDVTVSGQDQVAAVARAVQRAVARAVAAATGYPVAAVTVSVLHVELLWGGAR